MEAVSRPVSLEGLSRFLVEHESCDAGFDVGHPAGLGNGLISMTCRGCGKAYEYATGTIEIEREIEFEPVTVASGAGAPPKELLPRELPPKGEPRARKPAAGGPNRRRDRIIAAGLLVFAVAAFAFAVIRVLEAREGPAEPPAPTPAAGEAKPQRSEAASQPDRTPAPQPQTQTQQRQAQAQQPRTPRTGGAAPVAAAPVAPAAGPGEKEMKMVRFSLIVPESWTQRAADGGTLVGPPGGGPVSVQVFFEENPAVGMGTMISKSVEFARARLGGGTVGTVRRTRLGGNPAFEFRVRGAGGSAIVLGVLAGSYRHLVVGDVGRAASAAQEADLRRALATFRPS